uniref:Cytochrome P450 n=1 Tax=Pyxicephalus adspersus TaxID=30357 RepID=A0AAV2ZQI0_PYXAD|nr:TPA: hypothetical protein GDO54_017371 [Pyxicephalus adspersus]
MELSMIGTLILIFLLTFLVTIWLRKGRQSTLPSGPTPLPLLGNILQINFKDLVHAFVQVSTNYAFLFFPRKNRATLHLLCMTLPK